MKCDRSKDFLGCLNKSYFCKNKLIEKLLQLEPSYARITKPQMCGYVWFEDGMFYCELSRFKRHVDTIKADTLEKLVNKFIGYVEV